MNGLPADGPVPHVSKMRFSIHSCSGEDPEYPARELLYHSPHTRGWQTPRFCQYPQELVLRLDMPARISQIQILSHEFKISQKLEIYVGTLPPGETDPGRCLYKRLGHLSFHPNEKTNYQARELKTVHINHTAVMVKFLVYGPHMNQHNIYNQICLIAINLLGEPFLGGPGGALPGDPAVRDIVLDMNVDAGTAARIRELTMEKHTAIANEDYDRAKELKFAIDRLKEVGRKIGQLEARKRAAVDREDYDEAKQLKMDIDKLRAGGVGAAVPLGSGGSGGDVLARVAGGEPLTQAEYDAIPVGAGPTPGRGPAGSNPDGDADGEGAAGSDTSPDAGGRTPRQALAFGAGEGDVGGEGGSGSASRGKTGIAASPEALAFASSEPKDDRAHDERPAKGKGAYNMDDETGGITSGRTLAKVPSKLERPKDYPSDLPDPEPLSHANASDGKEAQEISDAYTGMALMSKNHRLREAALVVLEARLPKLPGAPKDIFRVMGRIVLRALNDKITSVMLAGASLNRALIAELAPRLPARDVGLFAHESLPLLISKAEDHNPKVRTAATELIMLYASQPEVGVSHLEKGVCKKPKAATATKQIANRLILVRSMLDAYGSSPDGTQGFSVECLTRFLGFCLQSPSADIRKSALEAVGQVHEDCGGMMREFLPQDLNPKIKAEVDAIFVGDGRLPVRKAPPQPNAVVARQAAPASTPRAAPVRKSGAGAPGAQKKKPAEPPAPARKANPAPAAAPAPVPVPNADDPASYARELRKRERELGPDHVEVAEMCSNLAILYNQNGDYADAQPLYERALRIWEKTKGPDCPDVAHTLTDLAVLYLEQGDDDRGKPLLERALAIQERELGPDHPDVQAIRDVLESEGVE